MLREFSPTELRRISDALVFAMRVHEGVERTVGEPYIAHPFRVALRALMSGMCMSAIVAALLHDVVEDASVSSEEIAARFGPEVASIVSVLTKAQAGTPMRDETYRRQLLSGPVDARKIKLFDIADNLTDVESIFPPERAKEYRTKRERLARELELSLQ